MSNRRNWIIASCAIIALVFGGAAWATIGNVKSYKEAYPGKEPKAYSCKICHQNAIGKKGELNPYGEALVEGTLETRKAPKDAKNLTVDDYRAVEAGDADHDGATNLQEIEAGTAPGDPASVPEGTQAPAAAVGTPGDEAP